MNNRHNILHSTFRRFGFLALLIVGAGLIVAYASGAASSTKSNRPAQLAAVSLHAVDDVTPQSSAVPTVDVLTFQMTVVAVMNTMPTYTPISHLPSVDDKISGLQRNELMWAAQKTVTAMEQITPILEPQPTPEPPLTPPVGPPTRVAGVGVIVDNPYIDVNKRYIAKNIWREEVGTRIVGVSAGSTYANPQRGVLVFEDSDTAAGHDLSGPELYQVPANVEWIKAVDAVGERVTLQADTGE